MGYELLEALRQLEGGEMGRVRVRLRNLSFLGARL